MERTFLVCWVLDGSDNQIDRVTVGLPQDADRDTIQDALYGAIDNENAYIGHAIELTENGPEFFHTFPQPR